ncbi:LysR family transcriptional regulator [Pannonibacter phragmitetus]|uniref:LysR family transcriptional regulator n=1 Tax=Pannonibacter phragmitetus TaxID=121719 RepID=UPI003D2ED804
MKAINLHRLQIFRTVYELAGIGAAARKLNLSQPTVSRHLAVFEDELKVSLFSNVAGRIEPTWEAQRLYAETNGLFERVAMLERSVEALQRGSSDSCVSSAPTRCVSR